MKGSPYFEWHHRRRWDDQHDIVHGPNLDPNDYHNIIACGPHTGLYLLNVKFKPITCLQCLAKG